MKPLAPRCTAFGALPWPAKFNALALCAGLAAFAALLWPQWRHDDNLTHGVFLPVLSAILLGECRRDPNPRFTAPGCGAAALCALLLIASLASGATAVVYATALGFTHAVTEFMLASGLVFALAAAWMGFADQRVRFIPLNWAAAMAIALWLFAAPPPPGTYTHLSFFLQTKVTHGVVGIMNGVGLAAYQNGNVIELAHTRVGVSEACSGVRSLISCTVAGLFLSGLLVRRPASRALVIVLSPAIGVAMNFLRSLLLTLLANRGVNIEGRWHDLTGASIVVVTTLLVAGVAFWLRRHETRLSVGPVDPRTMAGRSPLPAMLAAALVLAAGGAGVLAVGKQPSGAAPGAAPDLATLLPPAPSGWTVLTTPNMEKYSEVLQTHALVERVYSAGPRRDDAHLTLYLAYWRPGQAPVSLVDAHTPDACWPGTGWELEPVPEERVTLGVAGQTLPPAESRLFALDGFRTHVWFWHLYGGRPLTFVDPHSATRLLRLAWRYGFGHEQDQLFVRVSSDRPWREIASGPTLRQFFENLKPLGL